MNGKIPGTVAEGDPESISIRMTGSGFLSFKPSRRGMIHAAKSRPAALPRGGDALRNALEKAIDEGPGPRLSDIVDPRKRVVIVIDDHTRGTPTAPALEALHGRLRSLGVGDGQISILCSSGTHRRMSDEEIRDKTGDLGKRLEMIPHDCTDAGSLYLAGYIDGIPVRLNKALEGAGAVIGIGSLVAHKFAGWSGGAKIICPGVAGYETIYKCHYKSIVEEKIFPGQRDNWFRSFVDRVGDLAGLRWCLNFVPTAGGLAGLAAGDPRACLDANVSIAEDAMSTFFEARHDIVVVSSWPATTDLWQGGKGFYTGDMIVRDNGTLVLVTPLDEGLGDHPDFIALLDRTPGEILAMLRKGDLPDPLAAVASYAIRRIGERCSLRIVTSNRSLHGRPLLGSAISGDIQGVMDEAMRGDDLPIAVLDDGYVLPRLTRPD